MLTAAERRQLLSTWNETEGYFPADRCIHEWFEDQARRTPDAVAATFVSALGDPEQRKSLTYREMDQRANALVPVLRSCGVGLESVVGLFVERSLEALVGILGILKAGGAYLPLDPSYPAERLAYMIQDSGIRVLLTQSRLRSLLPISDDTASHPSKCFSSMADEPSVTTLLSHALGRGGEGRPTPDNLAYVIYTSGSTGKPKGTLLAHRGLCNLCQAMGDILGVNPSTRLLQFASLSFDASVPDLFMPLVFGGAIIMAPREILASTPELVRLVRQEGVNTAVLPPSLLRLLAPEEMPGLRAVVSAGEACPLDVAARWPVGRSFFNGYGPTETTVGASFYPVRELPRPRGACPSAGRSGTPAFTSWTASAGRCPWACRGSFISAGSAWRGAISIARS